MNSASDYEYKYKKLSVVNDQIYFKRERFPVDNVTNLGFSWTGQKIITNFVPTGEDNQVALTIYLSNRPKPISIHYLGAHTRKIILEDTFSKAMKIHSIYKHLSQLTFEKRLHNYISEVENKGYFTYTEAEFYRNGTLKLLKRNEVIELKYFSISRVPFAVYLKEKKPEPSTIMGLVKKKLSSPYDYSIPTQIDQDVFFSLLDHYYGYRWR